SPPPRGAEGRRGGRAALHHRTGDARGGIVGRGATRDRPWRARGGGRAQRAALRDWDARCGARHRVRAGPGHRAWRRALVVTLPTVAALFAGVLLLTIATFILVASYNATVALRQRIDKAWSNIDVVLKQRHDQLPNLVQAVRGVMAFERDVLTGVARARAAYSPTA